MATATEINLLNHPSGFHDEKKGANWKNWLAKGALFAVIASKLAKLAKFKTLISMAVFIGAHAIQLGWSFAAVFAALILCHELGHVYALRKMGIKASAPVFIPFLGAAIAMKERPLDAYKEGIVGLSGPIYGSVAATACLWAGFYFESHFWAFAAMIGFIINGFNMLPVLPLDGGRASSAISTKIWWLGLILAGVIIYALEAWVLLFIVLLGCMEAIGRYKDPKMVEYYKVGTRKRLIASTAFFMTALMTLMGGLVALIVDQYTLGTTVSATTIDLTEKLLIMSLDDPWILVELAKIFLGMS